MPTTRQMSDLHEGHVAFMMGGRVTRGSGCTARDQLDGRQSWRRSIRFAWDAKCTLGKSLSITREVWAKVVVQAHDARPMMALRWYRNERLDVELELGVTTLADLSELAEQSRCMDLARELVAMVAEGRVSYPDRSAAEVADDLVADLLAVLDGGQATRGAGLPTAGSPEVAA